MSFKPIACVLTLALASVSPAIADAVTEEEAGLEAALAGYERTGETLTCLSTRSIRSIDPVDEVHWFVETRAGKVYLNTVRGGCNDADSPFTALQYSLTSSQLCRGEIIRVIDTSSGFQQGACVLGEYEALTPVE